MKYYNTCTLLYFVVIINYFHQRCLKNVQKYAHLYGSDARNVSITRERSTLFARRMENVRIAFARGKYVLTQKLKRCLSHLLESIRPDGQIRILCRHYDVCHLYTPQRLLTPGYRSAHCVGKTFVLLVVLGTSSCVSAGSTKPRII